MNTSEKKNNMLRGGWNNASEMRRDEKAREERIKLRRRSFIRVLQLIIPLKLQKSAVVISDSESIWNQLNQLRIYFSSH